MEVRYRFVVKIGEAGLVLPAIYFMHYNFVRIHQTLKVTPAMAAGVTPKLWKKSDMVAVPEVGRLPTKTARVGIMDGDDINYRVYRRH